MLAVADRGKRPAEQRVDDAAHDPRAGREKRERQVVERERTLERHRADARRRRNADDADDAVRETIPLLDHQIDEVADAHRENREVVAPQAQRQHADEQAEHGGDGAAEHEREPERKLMVDGEDADGVGADREEAAVREVELAGVTGDQVQADRREREDVGGRHHRQRVVVPEQRRQDEPGGKECDPAVGTGWFHAARTCFANRPCGRSDRIATSSTNAIRSW